MELKDVPGLGAKSVSDLNKRNIRTVKDLKKIKDEFSDETRLFLELNPSRKVSRAQIKKIADVVLSIPSACIAGSYRRGKPYGRDVDILVYATQFDNLLKRLESRGTIHIYLRGPNKISAYYRLNGARRYLKIDIFTASRVEYIYSLLYLTGSKEHNIVMRSIAKKKGYTLNQYGLFKDGNRVTISRPTEEKIFEFLGMTYKKPENREITWKAR
jgi:DNA polymerase/3'-5' exonuclease PolX